MFCLPLGGLAPNSPYFRKSSVLIVNETFFPKTTAYKYGPLLCSVRLKIRLGSIFKGPRISEVPVFMFSTRWPGSLASCKKKDQNYPANRTAVPKEGRLKTNPASLLNSPSPHSLDFTCISQLLLCNKPSTNLVA